jgi:hypothetical protein
MEGYVIFSSSGCLKQFRIVKKIYHRLKSQGKDHAVNGFMPHRVQTMTVSVQGMRDDSGVDVSLPST